jgi:DNA-binding transcriptional MerR regulator
MSTAQSISSKSLADFLADQESEADTIGINDMVLRFKTSLRTLRLYETRGLLKPRQTGNGPERLYDQEAQQRFRLIDQSRKLGFTLTEISKLLAPANSVSELKFTIGIIRQQIRDLERQRAMIDQTLADLRRRYYLMGDPGDDD